MWKNSFWILHQNNLPAHFALPEKVFLAKHSISVLYHLPYSTDVAFRDFYLFIKIKSEPNETRFDSVESVKAKAAYTLTKLTKEDFQYCFALWKIKMERHKDTQGKYTEEDKVSSVIADE